MEKIIMKNGGSSLAYSLMSSGIPACASSSFGNDQACFLRERLMPKSLLRIHASLNLHESPYPGSRILQKQVLSTVLSHQGDTTKHNHTIQTLRTLPNASDTPAASFS